MVIGGSKAAVVKNIKQAVAQQNFHAKVETADPHLSSAQSLAAMHQYWQYKATRKAVVRNRLLQPLANFAAWVLNLQTQFDGLENIRQLRGPAILTSNHCNPFDNMSVRRAVRKAGRQHLYVIAQDANLLKTGLVGWLVRNYDVLPITSQPRDFNYMGREFPIRLQQVLEEGHLVLIYPEQELWYNYRKPRPLQRGAYYYAARCGVPIVPCFNEIIDTGRPDNAEFNKIRLHLHVLSPIYPDPSKSPRENSFAMRRQDFQEKKSAYELAYGEPLTYQWENGDIVGWRRLPS